MTQPTELVLTGLRRYPVKSCRGEDLTEASVEPWGLAGDRRWMLVDPTGEVVTAREANRLVLVTTGDHRPRSAAELARGCPIWSSTGRSRDPWWT